MIAAIFALALWAPTMSFAYSYYLTPYNFYNVPGVNYNYNVPPDVTRAAYSDVTALKMISDRAKPLLDQAETIANDIFPNDGQPIVDGYVIRTKYGNAPLPAGNVLDPTVRAELTELSDVLEKVVSSENVDPVALNKLLELSRDMQLNYLN